MTMTMPRTLAQQAQVRFSLIASTLLVLGCILWVAPGLSLAYSGARAAAPTPPRGWNSWDAFNWKQGYFNEAELLEVAGAMQKEFLPYGYDTVTIDEFWYMGDASVPGSIDEYGRAVPNVTAFPSSAGGKGLRPVADAIHAMGLKLGLHIMHTIPHEAIARKSTIKGTTFTVDTIAVPSACPWNGGWFGANMSRPGAQEYIDSLYQLYAEWDLDFIKNDCTFAQNMDLSNIKAVNMAMLRSGHPFVYSLSPGGGATLQQAQQVAPLVNMYRITNDWHGPGGSQPWQEHISQAALMAPMIASPGKNGTSWPDLDMLAMSLTSNDEEVFQMTLWCIARSPLIMGKDVRSETSASLWFYTNPEVLEVQAASVGNGPIFNTSATVNGAIVYTSVAWAAYSSDFQIAYLALFNPSAVAQSFSIPLAALRKPAESTCTQRDLWAHKVVTTTLTGSVTATLQPGTAQMFSIYSCA